MTTSNKHTATPMYAWLLNGASRAANVDGSSTPVVFSWTATGRTDLHRVLVLIKDAGTFDADLYGNGAILTNGIDVEVVQGGVTTDLLDGFPIKTNAEWGGICHDVSYLDIGTGDNVLLVRWTFSRSGVPIRMAADDVFRVRVNDNLSVLTGHTFHLQGADLN